jgi:hypothetical protein
VKAKVIGGSAVTVVAALVAGVGAFLFRRWRQAKKIVEDVTVVEL